MLLEFTNEGPVARPVPFGERLDLIQAFYQLDETPRRRLLDLAKSLHVEGAPAR